MVASCQNNEPDKKAKIILNEEISVRINDSIAELKKIGLDVERQLTDRSTPDFYTNTTYYSDKTFGDIAEVEITEIKIRTKNYLRILFIQNN